MPETNNTNEKEYYTIVEAAARLRIKRASLYYYLNALGIETHKFKLNKKSFIARADLARIEQVKQQPWLAGPEATPQAPSAE